MSIGASLAQARRQAGLTVAEVGQQTRIRETIIRGIEDDDYSACGGDSCTRSHIRSIAEAVGTDPEPLIQEYDAAYRPPGELPAVSLAELIAPGQSARRHRPPLSAVLGLVLGLVLAVTFGVAGAHFLAGPPWAASTRPVAGHHRTTGRHPGDTGNHQGQQAGSPGAAHHASDRGGAPAASPRAAGHPRTLAPVSAAAFGASGAGQGDNPSLAPLAVDAEPGTAWRSDWYTTARLGNLYPGTGLLLDMGRPVTIVSARITLGRTAGASFELRIGTAPSLADLRTAAWAGNAGGVIRLRPRTPARGRYALIWFTRLPPNRAGTFQVRVYDITLAGAQVTLTGWAGSHRSRRHRDAVDGDRRHGLGSISPGPADGALARHK